VAAKREVLRPLDRYMPTTVPIDTKEFVARAYGLSSAEVTWQHRDPVTYWLRRKYPKLDSSDRSLWYLTRDMQVRAHRYLMVASSDPS
jgi:hypothetical protein